MPRINLAKSRRQTLPRPVLWMMLALLPGVVAPLYIWHGEIARETQVQRRANIEQRNTLAALQQRLAAPRASATEHRTLIAAHRALHELRRAGQRRAAVLYDLAALHEPGVHYTALRFNDARLRLQGVAASARDLDALLVRLGATPWFREPALQTPHGGAGARAGAGRGARTRQQRPFVLSAHYRETQPAASLSAETKQ